jgi:enoyl-CoA hydratase
MPQQTDAERWGGLDPEPPPAHLVEPEDRMLLEYVSDGRVAMITVNRPQANNALTTAMAAPLRWVVGDGVGSRAMGTIRRAAVHHPIPLRPA